MAKQRRRLDPNRTKCGAMCKRSKQPCNNPAGFRTSHPGTKCCYLHGGCGQFPTGPANPAYKHGGFSKHLLPEEEARFAAFRAACGLMQDEPSDEEELALFRLVTATVGAEITPKQLANLLREISETRLRYQKLRGGDKPDKLELSGIVIEVPVVPIARRGDDGADTPAS